MSPFQVMYGHQPRKPIDFVPLPLHAHILESVEEFAQHVKSLHESVSKQINLSNDTYKCLADSHKHHHAFKEGDQVMIRVHPERFPSGTVKKL